MSCTSVNSTLPRGGRTTAPALWWRTVVVSITAGSILSYPASSYVVESSFYHLQSASPIGRGVSSPLSPLTKESHSSYSSSPRRATSKRSGNTRILYSFDGSNQRESEKISVGALQRLQQEKLDLQHDFENFRLKQKKQEQEWERKVEKLVKTIQELKGTALPNEGHLNSLSAETMDEVEQLRERVQELELELEDKINVINDMPPDLITLKKEYEIHLRNLTEKHSVAAKVAEEQMMRMKIHNQKFQQGIKDQAAGKQERLKIEYDAKLARKDRDLTAAQQDLKKAKERIKDLEECILDMHHDNQSLRKLVRSGMNLVKARITKRFAGGLFGRKEDTL